MTRAGGLTLALCASRPALAYRPFDGTDAAVAERGQLEIELGPVGLLREGSDQFLVLSALIVNVGFAERLEFVLEGRHLSCSARQPGAPRTRLVDTVAFSRSHDLELVGSVIVEGPPTWVVRPVFELFSEGQVGGPFALTGLAGMIWRSSDSLAFDAGLRAGRAAGQTLVEGRLGLTFAFDVAGSRLTRRL